MAASPESAPAAAPPAVELRGISKSFGAVRANRDIDFAAPKPANTVPLAEHQVQVGEAESRGYRNGFAEGQREAEGQTARRLAIADHFGAHQIGHLVSFSPPAYSAQKEKTCRDKFVRTN